MATVNWLSVFFKISYFVFKKKISQVWNNISIFEWTILYLQKIQMNYLRHKFSRGIAQSFQHGCGFGIEERHPIGHFIIHFVLRF